MLAFCYIELYYRHTVYVFTLIIMKTETLNSLWSSQKDTIKWSQQRITTTVRLDSDLKRRAEECARMNHMDFTTFLSFSLQNTIQYGGRIEPIWQVSPKYGDKLEVIDEQTTSNPWNTHWPFKGRDAIDF